MYERASRDSGSGGKLWGALLAAAEAQTDSVAERQRTTEAAERSGMVHSAKWRLRDTPARAVFGYAFLLGFGALQMRRELTGATGGGGGAKQRVIQTRRCNARYAVAAGAAAGAAPGLALTLNLT